MLATVIAVQLSGCSDAARWVRQFTYPPEFRYIERDEVRGIMRVLAAHGREVNQLMRQDDALQEHRDEIASTCAPWNRRRRSSTSPAGRPTIRRSR